VKAATGVAILVLAIPMLQGALAPYFPGALRPDLALLVVFGLALCWRNSATGLVLAAASGFAVDLFSAGLLGQHALLSVLVFGASRLLTVHMAMAGAVSRMLFAAVLTVAHAFGLAALTSFFTPGAGFGLLRPSYLGPHVVANALVAPIVTGVVAGIAAWISGEDTSGHRTLRIDTRRWVA